MQTRRHALAHWRAASIAALQQALVRHFAQ
jgi:hypothetical protein